MTAETVIKAVRDRIGDDRKERWDDTTLLLYVSLCQNDICMFTHFYRRTALITLTTDSLLYDLPTDCIVANRFEYNGLLVPVETRNSIDDGNVEYPLILKDNLAFNQIQFMIESSPDLETSLTSVFGVVSLSDELSPPHGVTATVYGDEVLVDSGFGNVLVHYTAMPKLLEMADYGEGEVLPTEDLILPDVWFQAFLHFVCGMALQDDNDANNVQRGELEGSKYLRILSHIQKVSSKDFTSNMKTKLVTRFRRT